MINKSVCYLNLIHSSGFQPSVWHRAVPRQVIYGPVVSTYVIYGPVTYTFHEGWPSNDSMSEQSSWVRLHKSTHTCIYSQYISRHEPPVTTFLPDRQKTVALMSQGKFKKQKEKKRKNLFDICCH